MIEEFHKRLHQNIDLSPLLEALNQIPQLPAIDYHPQLNDDEIQLLTKILDHQELIRQDKLQPKLIIEFKQLIDQITLKESTFYLSCVEQFEKHVKNLDYHSQREISNWSLSNLSIQSVQWILSNCILLPELNQTMIQKFQQLILNQLELIQQEEQIMDQVLFQSNNIQVFVKNENLILKSNYHINRQSEMINILVGFLTYFNYINVDIQEFLIKTISSKYRQHFIALQNPIFDEVKVIEKYEKQIKQCLEQANLSEIIDKQYQFTQLDKLKQNLIKFKNHYVEAIDKLQFKQQKQQNWNLGFFKSKTETTQKIPNQIFDQMQNDWKVLDTFLQNNTDKNEQIYQLIFDHIRLLDVCLDYKELQHNFQSLNFYVTIYTQIDQRLIKLLHSWKNELLIDYIYNIKIKLRHYSFQASEFIDI
ncbi:unnamed protein product [Paramecium primaurelia]|uniref:Uncharacterized protein n=1 Tax=Paramecium primaurelia TaxID=5886 RepID=A0A8S1K5Y9_PARPR|nr:unnamed protein product [Paramecium primaurelia]